MIQERSVIKVVPIRSTRSVVSESRIRDFVPMPLGIEDSRYNSYELYRNTKSGQITITTL